MKATERKLMALQFNGGSPVREMELSHLVRSQERYRLLLSLTFSFHRLLFEVLLSCQDFNSPDLIRPTSYVFCYHVNYQNLNWSVFIEFMTGGWESWIFMTGGSQCRVRYVIIFNETKN